MKALKRKRENGVHHHGLLYCLLFYVFWCFNFLGFTNTGETTHPKVSHFLDNEQHSREHTFQIHNSQSRAHTPTATFTGLSYSRPLIICPNHPRARCQTSRDSRVPLSPLKSPRLANLKPIHLGLPASSCRNHKKGCCTLSRPISSLTLGLRHALGHLDMACPLHLGTVSIELSSHGNHPLIHWLAVPYLKLSVTTLYNSFQALTYTDLTVLDTFFSHPVRAAHLQVFIPRFFRRAPLILRVSPQPSTYAPCAQLTPRLRAATTRRQHWRSDSFSLQSLQGVTCPSLRTNLWNCSLLLP